MMNKEMWKWSDTIPAPACRIWRESQEAWLIQKLQSSHFNLWSEDQWTFTCRIW